VLGGVRATLADAAPHWAAAPDDVQQRWLRDAPLLKVADRVRAARTDAAWARPARRPAATLRTIRPADDPVVAEIIRTVMPEFGASGPGFAILDPEVDAMSVAYTVPRSVYYVAEAGARVIGGGGVGPLIGGDESVCELRKMYFLKEARGTGAGKALLAECIAAARRFGYRTMYLETLTGMDAARALYEKNGFLRLDAPMGKTGHFGCNRFYALALGAEGTAP
jgi:putative acetyltransferase